MRELYAAGMVEAVNVVKGGDLTSWKLHHSTNYDSGPDFAIAS